MQFDIIIVGGGMVGAALASALRSPKIKIALVDASLNSTMDDPRLIALNYNSVCLFKNLNIWPALQAEAAQINEVHVSHRSHFGTTRINTTDLEIPALGYVVPAKFINAALYQALDNITVLKPAKLKNLVQSAEHVALTIDTAEGCKNITGKIIIGADGTQSTVRDLINISTEEIDYRQSAIVTITQLKRSHHSIAYERFLKTGAIAMLPLKGDRVATIWTDNNEITSDLMQLSDQEFLAILQKQFGYRLGRLAGIETRHIFPLKFIQAEKQQHRRVILIGNAAHTFHPIAAQGLNLAMYEVSLLADHFAKHDLDELSLHDFALKQQKISQRLSHHLTQVFSADFFIIRQARQMAMLGLDLSPSLKKHFTRHAMGRFGHLPTLIRENEIHEREKN